MLIFHSYARLLEGTPKWSEIVFVVFNKLEHGGMFVCWIAVTSHLPFRMMVSQSPVKDDQLDTPGPQRNMTSGFPRGLTRPVEPKKFYRYGCGECRLVATHLFQLIL
jgi:hypothetical protein